VCSAQYGSFLQFLNLLLLLLLLNVLKYGAGEGWRKSVGPIM
jgi:hypothetical protein